ncbi:MAG: ABC transporter ATP-binding protein, partial [Sulfitobacter sp.]
MSDVTYTSSELLKWLWRDYLRKHMGLLMIALVFMAVEGATMGALAKLMQPMFDQVFVAGQENALIWVGLVLVGI